MIDNLEVTILDILKRTQPHMALLTDVKRRARFP